MKRGVVASIDCAIHKVSIRATARGCTLVNLGRTGNAERCRPIGNAFRNRHAEVTYSGVGVSGMYLKDAVHVAVKVYHVRANYGTHGRIIRLEVRGIRLATDEPLLFGVEETEA